MEKKSLTLYWALVLNLLLWFGTIGIIAGAGISLYDLNSSDMIAIVKFTSIAGCILAAFLQHWAYYKIYKPSKQQENEEKQNSEMHGIF